MLLDITRKHRSIQQLDFTVTQQCLKHSWFLCFGFTQYHTLFFQCKEKR